MIKTRGQGRVGWNQMEPGAIDCRGVLIWPMPVAALIASVFPLRLALAT